MRRYKEELVGLFDLVRLVFFVISAISGQFYSHAHSHLPGVEILQILGWLEFARDSCAVRGLRACTAGCAAAYAAAGFDFV